MMVAPSKRLPRNDAIIRATLIFQPRTLQVRAIVMGLKSGDMKIKAVITANEDLEPFLIPAAIGIVAQEHPGKSAARVTDTKRDLTFFSL
jgi:hypothetical protein